MNFESIVNMAKGAKKAEKGQPDEVILAGEKAEKSQAELRAILEQKLNSLKPALQEGIKEYEQALNGDIFEDQDGEAEGAGDVRREAMQGKLSALFDRAEKMKNKLDSGEALAQSTPEISATYARPDGKKETITLDLEAKLQDFLSFYQKTSIDLPADFEDSVREIWDRNQTEIEQAIEQNGFDDMLIVPGNIPLADLAEKMKMEKGYAFYQVKEDFSNVKSQNVDKPRIILYHKATLPEVQKETGLDIHLNITGGDALKLFEQNPEQYLSTLEDFMIMEKKNFEKTGTHLSDYRKNSSNWLPGSKAGARLVHSDWGPGDGRLDVSAGGPGAHGDGLGLRPARCFF